MKEGLIEMTYNRVNALNVVSIFLRKHLQCHDVCESDCPMSLQMYLFLRLSCCISWVCNLCNPVVLGCTRYLKALPTNIMQVGNTHRMKSGYSSKETMGVYQQIWTKHLIQLGNVGGSHLQMLCHCMKMILYHVFPVKYNLG